MRLTLTALLALSMAGSQAFGQKLSPELKNIPSEASVDVIVQYRHTPTATHHDRVAARGGELKRGLGIIRAAHYSMPASQLEALSHDPDVEFISPNRKVFTTDDNSGNRGTAAYTGNPDYGWQTVGADLATSVFGLDGTGVGVAVIDSGVGTHDDLKKNTTGHDGNEGSGRVVYTASLVPQREDSHQDASDQYGHGSHVAGIIAGNGADSTGKKYRYTVRGIAPNANIISLKASMTLA